MSEGIWATWYDLPADDKGRYLDWAHASYLPFLRRQPAYRWVAHYRYASGGAQMARVKDSVVSHTEEDVGQGSQYLVLVGAAGAHSFFAPSFAELEMPTDFAPMLALREGVRTAVFTLEASVDGPSRARSQATTSLRPRSRWARCARARSKPSSTSSSGTRNTACPPWPGCRAWCARASGPEWRVGPSTASFTNSSRWPIG